MNIPFHIKQIIVAIQYRIDQWLPRCLGVYVRNRCWPWKPVLDAVELHLSDRCNMNCTGCAHFSNFADEWQADSTHIQRDLVQLKTKFKGGIRHVNLLGGEPLLNRKVCSIIKSVRTACPRAKITMVTNGLLLLAQPSGFWETCRNAKVHLNLTLYGPVAGKRQNLLDKCTEERVPIRIQEGNEFFAKMKPDGNSNPRKAFGFCRRTTYCPYLREGRLYVCAQAYHIRDFVREVRKAGYAIDDVRDEGLDIYKKDLSGRRILHYLMTPGPVCRFCADSVRLMKWSRGSKDIRDWFWSIVGS